MVQHPEYSNIPLKEMLCLYDLDQTYDLVLATELGGWRTTGDASWAQYQNSRFFDYLIHFWEQGTLIDYHTPDDAPFADQLGYLLYQFYLPFSGSTLSQYVGYTDINIAELYQTLDSVVDWENYVAVEIQLPAYAGEGDRYGTITYYCDDTANSEYIALRYPAYLLNKRIIHYSLTDVPQTIKISFDSYHHPVVGTFVVSGANAGDIEASIPSIWLYSNLPVLLEWLDTRVNAHWSDRGGMLAGYSWQWDYDSSKNLNTYFQRSEIYGNKPAWYKFCWHITANNRGGKLVERGDTKTHDVSYASYYGGEISEQVRDLARPYQGLFYTHDRVITAVYVDDIPYAGVQGHFMVIPYPYLGTPGSGTVSFMSVQYDVYYDLYYPIYSAQPDNIIPTLNGAGHVVVAPYIPYTSADGKSFYKEFSGLPMFLMGTETTDVQRYRPQGEINYKTLSVSYTFHLYGMTLSTGTMPSPGTILSVPYTIPYTNGVASGSAPVITHTASGTITLTPPGGLYDYIVEDAYVFYSFDQFIQTQDLTIMVDSQRIKEIHAALQADKFAWMPNTTDTLRNANLGYYIERIARILGISVKPDASLRTIRPKKFIKAGEVIPAGWYGGCFGSNTGGSLQGQPGGTPDEERDGIVYEIKSNLYDPENGTIEAGGYALCENWIQYLDAMADDLDKALGWQELGALALPSADATRQVVLEGLAAVISEVFFNSSALSINTTETHATTLGTNLMVREILSGLGLPLVEKVFEVDIGAEDSGGFVSYPGYAKDAPRVSTLLFTVLQNLGFLLAGQVGIPNPNQTSNNKELNNNLNTGGGLNTGN